MNLKLYSNTEIKRRIIEKRIFFSGFSGQAKRCLQVFRENQSRIVILEEDKRLVFKTIHA